MPTCSDQINNGVAVAGDPDVSGLGVIFAFILTAYITLAAVLVAYAFGLVDDGLLRPVDRIILRVPSQAEKYPRIHRALRKAVLSLSDTQIVTGIAILGAGFQGLRTGSINVYHYQIVVYLAWMSSSVHLSALTLLRPFLYYHRGVMVWRLMGMFVLFIMLIVALVPTTSNGWAVIPTIPFSENFPANGLSPMGAQASCFWTRTYGHGVNPDSILSFAVLFISYLWKMGGIFMPFRNTFARVLEHPVDCIFELLLRAMAKRYEKNGRLRWLWIFRICLAAWLPVVAVLEVLASFSAALWLSVLGLLYGTMQVLIPRSLVLHMTPSLAEQESALGFGQLVPLILLVQPIGSISEHFWLRGKDDEPIYRDHGGADPYSSTLGAFQEGKNLVGLSNEPLLQFMASYTPPPWTQTGPQRLQLRAFLYTSRTFGVMIWGVQAATTATAIIVLYWDQVVIGWEATGNWFYIFVAMAAWFGGCPIIVFLLLPFSRLGRYWKRERRPSAADPASIIGTLRLRSLSLDRRSNDKASSPTAVEANVELRDESAPVASRHHLQVPEINCDT